MVDRHQHRTGSDLERDAEALARYAADLSRSIDAALPGWVERSVERSYRAPLPDAVRVRARAAGRAAAIEVGGAVRDLLELDIDAQWTNPLALLRSAVRFPTEVLRDAGVPTPPRDRESERLHPDDLYDLTPASFGDVDPSLHEPGIVWGAAKAHVHLARRRLEGRR